MSLRYSLGVGYLREERVLGSGYVLTTKVNFGAKEDALAQILCWAEQCQGRSICFAPVHTIMESFYQEDFRQLINNCDLVLPDGLPVAWAIRRLGKKQQQRIDGSSTMLELCRRASAKQWAIGLYGGHPEWLEPLKHQLCQLAPGLLIGFALAPPFRPLTPAEDAKICQDICASGVRLLFVGLGCPKQERWIAQHRQTIPLPLLGVGAAFDFYSGHKHRAPLLWQRLGCEWLFRLLCEPRRLWRRYLLYNTAFLWHSRFFSSRRLRSYHNYAGNTPEGV